MSRKFLQPTEIYHMEKNLKGIAFTAAAVLLAFYLMNNVGIVNAVVAKK